MEGKTVSVMAFFKRGELQPKAFRYQGRTVLLDRVTLKYRTKDGGRDAWLFNVQSGDSLHTLAYEPSTWRWRLLASWDALEELVS